MVGGSHIGAVVDGDGVFAETTRRLKSHKHVTEVDSGNGEAAVGTVYMAWGVTPIASQFGGDIVGKAGEPLDILPGIHMACRQSQLLLGEEVAVVAAAFDDPGERGRRRRREMSVTAYPASLRAWRTRIADAGVSMPTALPMRASFVG